MSIKLCENIKRLREEMGITQGELANVLAVTAQSVSRWEKGLAYPDIEKLPQIACYFNITIDELIGVTEPTIHSISRELVEVRNEIRKNKNAELMLKYLDLLDKSVKIGSNIFLSEYISVSEELKCKGGWISDERADEIFQTVKGKLCEMSPNERVLKLLPILINEEESKLSRWQDLVMPESTFSTWNDLLMYRYDQRCEFESYELCRRKMVFDEVSKLVYSITAKSGLFSDSEHVCYESLDNCFLAKSIIDSFSKCDDDLFLFNKIVVEGRLLHTAIVLNNNEQIHNSIIRLKELISLSVSLRGKSLKGSVSMFEDMQINCDWPRLNHALFDIDMKMFSHDFERLKKSNSEFYEFANFIEKIHGDVDPFYYVNNRESFKKLYELAYTAAINHKAKSLTYVFALETQKGNLFIEKLENCLESDEAEKKLLSKLNSNNDTQIERIVGFLCDNRSNPSLDMPSFRFRDALCALNNENLNAKILMQGMHSYNVKDIRATFPSSTVLKYDTKNR